MIIRVSIINSDPGWQRDWLFFDVAVDQDMNPQADRPFFGYRGLLGKPSRGYGLLIGADGSLEPGFGRTNLRERAIVIGEYRTIWWKDAGHEDEVTYRIGRLHSFPR